MKSVDLKQGDFADEEKSDSILTLYQTTGIRHSCGFLAEVLNLDGHFFQFIKRPLAQFNGMLMA